MPKQYEEKIVPFTKEQMFHLVADIDRYDEFIPWCNKSNIITRSEDTNFTNIIADLEIGYNQFCHTYRSNVKLSKNQDFINVNHLEGPFEFLENKWEFISISESSSKIIFSIDFELNIKMFNLLMNKFFDIAFKKMVNSFNQRAKEIY
tara:strand:- start:166 stop:609 length:444 start_codon:yes stop_codon:yes gene_type:complete